MASNSSVMQAAEIACIEIPQPEFLLITNRGKTREFISGKTFEKLLKKIQKKSEQSCSRERLFQ